MAAGSPSLSMHLKAGSQTLGVKKGIALSSYGKFKRRGSKVRTSQKFAKIYGKSATPKKTDEDYTARRQQT